MIFTLAEVSDKVELPIHHALFSFLLGCVAAGLAARLQRWCKPLPYLALLAAVALVVLTLRVHDAELDRLMEREAPGYLTRCHLAAWGGLIPGVLLFASMRSRVQTRRGIQCDRGVFHVEHPQGDPAQEDA